MNRNVIEAAANTTVALARPTGAPAVWSSAKMVELDFAGIEAVLTGWFMRDPAYIRLAKLGMHAYVASHVLGRPADLGWTDQQLAGYLKEIKDAKDEVASTAYGRSKRIVHGSAYGLTTYGMCRNYPRLFPTVKSAEAVQQVYFDVAPGLPQWHMAVRHTAYTQRYLGGADPYSYLPTERKVAGHPYQYKHWFWSVVAYERLTIGQKLWREKRGMPVIDIGGQPFGVTLGEDAKAAIALYPQSTARGVLTEAALPLFDPEDPLADLYYIGDQYYGETPLRAPIHDSLLLEVPTRRVDVVLERAAAAMQRPILALPCPLEWAMGTHLTIGVDAKAGPSWGAMEKVALPSWAPGLEPTREVAGDMPVSPTLGEDGDEDEMLDLEVVA